jgi:thioredoxin-related protein
VTRDWDDYPKSLKAKMVPMSYFLRPDGTVIYRMPGYWTSEDYLSILRDAEKKAAKSARNKEKQQ